MKMSMNIPDDEVDTIREFSASRSITMTDTVRAAVRLLKTLRQAELDGNDILIRDTQTHETSRLVIL